MNSKNNYFSFLLFFVLGITLASFVVATVALAETSVKPKVVVPPALEVSGWIPYWRTATGTAEALVHLDAFTEINPFGYTVRTNGTLFDALGVDDMPWQTLIAAARAKKVRVIPTVMWGNGTVIHTILSNGKKRRALEDEIAKVVHERGFDGIDIDFEGKKAETRPYFSLFLKGLYARIGKKWVMCTIEPRTPLDSRYDTIPKNISYSNDFVEINKYCDRVRIMAYDQGAIDIRLNEVAAGPYVPVADPRWVEKVINLVAKTIPKKKLVIGIPTYGYEYEVTPLTYGYRYDRLWAFNQRYATELATQLGITPERNSAGELSFMYRAVSSTSPQVSVATDTTPSNNSQLANTIFSQNSSAPVLLTTPEHIVWWSDASAIKDKVELAKKLGVRGVAIFKIDGGADPALWEVLK